MVCRKLYGVAVVSVALICLSSPVQSFSIGGAVIGGLGRCHVSQIILRQRGGRVVGPRMQVVDDKTEVREYFNKEGFNRYLLLE